MYDENNYTWHNCLLFSTVYVQKPLLEYVLLHLYFVLIYFVCLRNWYRMQKMLVPQRLGFYMMKLSMEQKHYGQRTWHSIRVRASFIKFGHYSSICMLFGVSCPSSVPFQLLSSPSPLAVWATWEAEKALALYKLCSVITKPALCYCHCFQHKSTAQPPATMKPKPAHQFLI